MRYCTLKMSLSLSREQIEVARNLFTDCGVMASVSVNFWFDETCSKIWTPTTAFSALSRLSQIITNRDFIVFRWAMSRSDDLPIRVKFCIWVYQNICPRTKSSTWSRSSAFFCTCWNSPRPKKFGNSLNNRKSYFLASSLSSRANNTSIFYFLLWFTNASSPSFDSYGV